MRSDPETLCRRGCFHGMRASLERERARVILGWSGTTTARLASELLALAEAVCKMMPLVDGRLRNGRTGLLDREVDLSLSFSKLTGYLSCSAAVPKARFKCQLMEVNECKRQQTAVSRRREVVHRV